MSSTNTRSSGVGFPALLGLLFIGLKLTGYINWSWWWVLSPFWISLSLWLTIILVAGAIVLMDRK